MNYWLITRARGLALGFHGDGAREQNVVFQMNVLMQVGFETLQRVIERAIADARVFRNRVIAGNGPQ